MTFASALIITDADADILIQICAEAPQLRMGIFATSLVQSPAHQTSTIFNFVPIKGGWENK